MMLGGRKLGTILKAVFRKEHYIALVRMMQVYDRPMVMLFRYLSSKGTYPFLVSLNTPIGKIRVKLYSHHDLLTVNEIFCRQDYHVPSTISSVVDFGSNIGISALYFLTRNHTARIKLFEPLPLNIEKLKETLRGFEDRYDLYPIAVSTVDGVVEFGCEPTGRYGGIGKEMPNKIDVTCRNASSIFSEILSEPKFSNIDILKIDIEGLESKIVESIGSQILPHISSIYAEIDGASPDLRNFTKERYGPIVRWKNEFNLQR